MNVCDEPEPTSPSRRHSRMTLALRPAFVLVALALLLTACASAGSSAAPSEQPAASEAPIVSDDPGVGEPAPGGAELVEPQPGQQNVHPVTIERMDATASGTMVSVDAYWTSGVDPCYVLDHVEVAVNDDQTVDVTLFEGTSDPDAICVMMAVSKHTVFSFDVPGTGTWTVRDSQGDQQVEVVVS